jgi:hypothetical protein
MAAGNSGKSNRLALRTFEPVSEMLDSGTCEPLKAAVHGLLLATVALCATYNAAAWLKRRERHLAVNAIVYGAAVWWERAHVMHHLADCTAVPHSAEYAQPDATLRPGSRDAA